MASLGVDGGHNKILSNNVTFMARLLYNSTWCVLRYVRVIFQRKLENVIAKALNIHGLNSLFRFIFIPICILKIKRKLLNLCL